MTDRFAAQLRQHLLATADDRPADDQLASVLGRVAGTAQRHPLAARVTLDPGRIGPLPSFAVRSGLIAVALALATVAGTMMPGGASRPSTVFEGTWTTIDLADGSGMTLVIGAGQAPAVYFEDGYASGAACVKDLVKRFTARGTGDIVGSRMVATFPDGGGCGLATVGIGGTYEHDPRTDALTDQDGTIWTRALRDEPVVQASEVPAPTRAARTAAASPSPSPDPSPKPVDVTFESARHGVSIDHPETWQTRQATEPWTHGPLEFTSAAADVIFDPAYGEGLYLAIASQPYGLLSEDEWRDRMVPWLCPDGLGFGSLRVDDISAFGVSCDTTHAALVFTETRGYVIRLVVPENALGLSETYGSELFSKVLQTVDLRPEDAVDPAPVAPLATPALEETPAQDQTVAPTPEASDQTDS